ncbi:hypothetical protein U1Q18_035887, partial [Sarracenia purpurea var. burkii]
IVEYHQAWLSSKRKFVGAIEQVKILKEKVKLFNREVAHIQADLGSLRIAYDGLDKSKKEMMADLKSQLRVQDKEMIDLHARCDQLEQELKRNSEKTEQLIVKCIAEPMESSEENEVEDAVIVDHGSNLPPSKP